MLNQSKTLNRMPFQRDQETKNQKEKKKKNDNTPLLRLRGDRPKLRVHSCASLPFWAVLVSGLIGPPSSFFF
jgi:hypothetical protein